MMGIALHDQDIRTDFGGTASVVVAASAVGTPGREREPLLGAEKASRRDPALPRGIGDGASRTRCGESLKGSERLTPSWLVTAFS